MTEKSDKVAVDRRFFLKSATLAGAAVGTATTLAPNESRALPVAGKVMEPSAGLMQAETERPTLIAANAGEGGRPGSDHMVDVLRALDIEYVATNPASSCRGLHESINNYAMNKKPELLTVMHEEIGCAMAQGYAKVSGKPMGLLFHGTVGIQHAAMGVYNAWCDRVPMMILSGNHIDAAHRIPGVATTHAAQDPLGIIRDFTKWDDQPASLQASAEAMVRAYKISMTPPYAPVAISLDAHLQEPNTNEKIRIPKLSRIAPPQGDNESMRDLAKMLVSAENPVIVVDRMARTPRGMPLFIALAEITGAAVVDLYGRQNFPSAHPLNQTDRARPVVSAADFVLGLEVTDFWGIVNSYTDNPNPKQGTRIKPGTKLATITARDLYIRSNYQDFQRYQSVDLSIAADSEASLPALIEAVKSALTSSDRDRIAKRTDALRRSFTQSRDRLISEGAVLGWNESPISTARLSAEMWAAIKDHDWALVSRDIRLSNWPHRLWNFDKHYQYIGDSGGAGQGYGMGAAIGAALAHRDHGRLVVNVQGDGDLMYTPSAIWSAVHHKIPLLTIMHNNKGYHQEVMHVQRIGNWRNRGVDRAEIGTKIHNPDVDFVTLAKSMGMAGIGPISDPAALGPALKRAVAMVKAGEPVLVDVHTQPR